VNPVDGQPQQAQGASTIGRLRDFLARHRSLSVLLGMTGAGILLPLIVQVPPFSTFQQFSSWLNVFTLAGIYVLLALGLNIVVGLAGLLDLGYAAFFAIGSYTYAFGASPFSGMHIPFWPMLLVGAGMAAVFGVLLGAPTLRLRGDYLAIVTLGFGEIVPVVFKNSDTYTRGTNGISGIYPPQIFGYTFSTIEILPFYLVMLGIVTITMVLVYRLQESRLGGSWMGDREVWECMTHYERKAMMDRVFMFYDNDWLHPRFPGVRAVNWGVKRGFGFGGKRDESQGRIVLLAEELGEHPQRFLRVVNKRKQIRRDRSRANWADNLAAQ